MKQLVIITAHPDRDSLCKANADALEKAAKLQGLAVKRYDAQDFPRIGANPAKHGFPDEYDEPSDILSECEVVVIVSPMWNFGAPGILKNFLDGVVQARKLFHFVPHPILKFLLRLPKTKYIVPAARPVGLMKARKVLCVWTADGPEWYYRFMPWKNDIFGMTKNIFSYCGVRKFDQKIFGMTRKRNEEEIKAWLKKLENYQF